MSMVDYWDRAHRNNDRGALTGTTMGGTLEFLYGRGTVVPVKDRDILCIGVGTGDWIYQLKEAGARVASLDISLNALDKVKAMGPTYLSSEKLPLGAFDMALSLWVAPHMGDADLAYQLVRVLDSLKDDGVFALHYNEPLGWATGEDPLPEKFGSLEQMLAAGRAMRLRAQMEQMVSEAGGRIMKVVREMPSPNWKTSLISIHVGRK